MTVENVAIVPFLLHMAMCSSTLLKSMLCENLTQSKCSVINFIFVKKGVKWLTHY